VRHLFSSIIIPRERIE